MDTINLVAIIGLAIVTTAICILIKQYRPEFAMVASLCCGALIFGLIILNLTPAFDTIRELMDRLNLDNQYTRTIIKALGVCYITQLAADTCRDADQTAIAGKVELAGKVMIILLSLPLFKSLLDTAIGLITV